MICLSFIYTNQIYITWSWIFKFTWIISNFRNISAFREITVSTLPNITIYAFRNITRPYCIFCNAVSLSLSSHLDFFNRVTPDGVGEVLLSILKPGVESWGSLSECEIQILDLSVLSLQFEKRCLTLFWISQQLLPSNNTDMVVSMYVSYRSIKASNRTESIFKGFYCIDTTLVKNTEMHSMNLLFTPLWWEFQIMFSSSRVSQSSSKWGIEHISTNIKPAKIIYQICPAPSSDFIRP